MIIIFTSLWLDCGDVVMDIEKRTLTVSKRRLTRSYRALFSTASAQELFEIVSLVTRILRSVQDFIQRVSMQ